MERLKIFLLVVLFTCVGGLMGLWLSILTRVPYRPCVQASTKCALAFCPGAVYLRPDTLSLKRLYIMLLRDKEGLFVHDKDDTGGETMRGVTWGTFCALAPALGYPISHELFKRMPDRVWYQIFEYHWRITEGIVDERVRIAITDYLWGGFTALPRIERVITLMAGRTRHLAPLLDPTNLMLINMLNPAELAHEINMDRLVYLESLNSPKYIEGWKSRIKAIEHLLYSTEK